MNFFIGLTEKIWTQSLKYSKYTHVCMNFLRFCNKTTKTALCLCFHLNLNKTHNCNVSNMFDFLYSIFLIHTCNDSLVELSLCLFSSLFGRDSEYLSSWPSLIHTSTKKSSQEKNISISNNLVTIKINF